MEKEQLLALARIARLSPRELPPRTRRCSRRSPPRPAWTSRRLVTEQPVEPDPAVAGSGASEMSLVCKGVLW